MKSIASVTKKKWSFVAANNWYSNTVYSIEGIIWMFPYPEVLQHCLIQTGSSSTW